MEDELREGDGLGSEMGLGVEMGLWKGDGFGREMD